MVNKLKPFHSIIEIFIVFYLKKGCLLKNFVDLLKPYETDFHIELKNKLFHDFIWKILLNQDDINFFQVKNSNVSDLKIL